MALQLALWVLRDRRCAPSSVHMSVEAKVSGLDACDNEGCVGWADAEPRAWETAHHEAYTVRWSGYRQQAYRRRIGRAAAAGRSTLLGTDSQRAGRSGTADEAAAEGWPGTRGVLRGRAVRLWALSSAERHAERHMPGGGAVADPAAAGPSGEDEPARLPEPGEAAARRRADGDLGSGRGARGDAGSGAGTQCGAWGSDPLPPAHRWLSAAPGHPLSDGRAMDEAASGVVGAARIQRGGAPPAVHRAARRPRSDAGAPRSADRAHPGAGAAVVARLAGCRDPGLARLQAHQRRDHRRRDRRSATLLDTAPAHGLSRRGAERAFNRRHRRARTEAAWTYTRPIRTIPQTSAQFTPAVRAIADKARHRLSGRYRRLIARGKLPTVAVTAITRESLGFIWAIAHAAAPVAD